MPKQTITKTSAERQKKHIAHKRLRAQRLQCWIDLRHTNELAWLCHQLEDSKSSIIEQAIHALYQQELARNRDIDPHVEDKKSQTLNPMCPA